MTEEAKHTPTLERERDNWRANSVSRGKRLMKLRDMLVEVHDNIEDEGDRCYFGSTNDADALKDAWQWLDGFTMDAIIAEKDEYDLLTAIETVRAENANLAAELTTLRTKLAEAERALRDTPCPRPCNGRPDDFTAGQCFDALECGCSTGSALSQAQDPA